MQPGCEVCDRPADLIMSTPLRQFLLCARHYRLLQNRIRSVQPTTADNEQPKSMSELRAELERLVRDLDTTPDRDQASPGAPPDDDS